jgi:hypothetical protein
MLSGTSAAITEPASGIWDLNTKLVLSEHHSTSWKVALMLQTESGKKCTNSVGVHTCADLQTLLARYNKVLFAVDVRAASWLITIP